MKELGEKQQLQIIEKSGDESATFERAMLLTGYGRYHVVLTLACGVSAMASGFQNGLSAYVLPAAQCDLELTTSEMGLLNSAFLIGGTISAMLWGIMADVIGRRNILVWCLFADGALTLLSGFSQNFTVFFIFRLISGFVIGGPSTILLPFIGEFHPQKTRGAAICTLGIFWTISWLMLPALAWAIISLDFTITAYGWVFNSWRLFVSIMGVPSLCSAFLLSKYPETPKYLIYQGRDRKALQIMREIFVANTHKKAYEFPVTTIIHDDPKSVCQVNSITASLNEMWVQLCCLFSSPLLKYMALSGFIMFTNMFGYYGLGLWLPELFNRFEAYYNLHPNETITVCELAYFQEDNLEPMNAEITENLNVTSNLTSQIVSMVSNLATTQLSADNMTEVCNSFVDSQVFIRSIVIGFSCLLGNFASVYLAGRLDPRILTVATMVIPGICGCVIYFLRTSMQHLIAACIFSSLISTANVVVSGVMVDIFPTNVNSMAAAAAALAGRVGAVCSNLLFGLLLEISCEVPIFLVGGFVIFGGLLGLLLPMNPIDVPKKQSEKTFTISHQNLSEIKETQNLNSVR